jgi:hypothetical protein
LSESVRFCCCDVGSADSLICCYCLRISNLFRALLHCTMKRRKTVKLNGKEQRMRESTQNFSDMYTTNWIVLHNRPLSNQWLDVCDWGIRIYTTIVDKAQNRIEINWWIEFG